MRLLTLVLISCATVYEVVGAPVTAGFPNIFGVDLSKNNHYGAPIPPWEKGHKPGWYFGNNPGSHPGVPCLGQGPFCDFLKLFPFSLQCPHKPPYHPPKPPPHPTPPHKPPHSPPHSTHTTAHPTHTPPPPPPPPPPADGYTQVIYNITAAVQADDYLTYGLVDTVQDCKDMCNSVSECIFINSYHDVNGKDGSTQLTCALFSKCHTAADADNKGGQTQPDGSVDFITNSDGFCKSK